MPAIQGLTTLPDAHKVLDESLFEHLGEIAGILFFLLGAMTIVELVDVHDGFRVITDRISTTNRVTLLWVISWVSFFLSAGLDNMTTAIIICALL
ncbi:MAG: SLC13 family permease [Spirosomataceae bacterium]